MFTIFVGHPGIGKGRAINPAVFLAKEANTVNLVSDKVTIQYLLEMLARGFTTAHSTATGVTFGKDVSCLISAPELEVFLAHSDTSPDLSDLWECKDGPKDYGTRTKGLIRIEKPCPSLIGGMTLRQACDYLSPKIISGGFTRRVNFIYAGDKSKSISRPKTLNNGIINKKVDELINDLRHINSLCGELTLTNEAWCLFETYKIFSEKIDEFQDEATTSYATTKWVHVLKLATAIACATRDNLQITDAEIEKAILFVERSGNDIKRVFRASGDSSLAQAGDRVLRLLETRGFCTRVDIMNAMWRHVTSPELDVLLATLESGGLIATSQQGGKSVFRAVQQPQSQPQPQP